MTESPTTSARYAALAIRLSAVWLLAGALFKLFSGTPKLLPPLVRDHSPFTWDTTFHIAIAIELTFAFVAIVKPRLGWPLLAATFLFFEIVLIDMQTKGAESCGCLGESIKMPPVLMMSIDGVLLALMLATRPWQAFGKSESLGRATLATLALATAVSWSAPWLVIKSSDDVPQLAVTEGQPPALRYISMSPVRWIGQNVDQIEELTRWVPVEKLPTDGKIVLWRQSCDHCAAHLREMAKEDKGDVQIVLVQVRDEMKSTRAVDAMPEGAHVTKIELPDGVDGAFETPCEIRTEGGVVKAALYEADFVKLREEGEQH